MKITYKHNPQGALYLFSIFNTLIEFYQRFQQEIEHLHH